VTHPIMPRTVRSFVRFGPLRTAVVVTVAAVCAKIALAAFAGPLSATGSLWGYADLFVSCALASLLVAGAGIRLVASDALPTIRSRIVLAFATGSVVALLNTLFASLAMFTGTRELIFFALVSLFAAAVSIGVGSVFAALLSERVRAVGGAAAAVAAGDLSARVPAAANGMPRDETDALARSFNAMAAQLESAAARHAADEEARRTLVAAVSHDLRTPLAAMRAMIEAITDGVVTDPDTVARFHATMGREVRTLSALIDDLFELSRLEAGQIALTLAPAAVSDLVREVVEGLAAQAAAREVRLHAAVDDGTVAIATMNRPAVRRVLTNLVQNALRHTPADGAVRVSTAVVPEGVRVDVTDTGEGIPASDLPHVFERFYRGEKSRSRETGGAGLGLAIARGFIEAHGGRIWVESTPGRGTHVSFLLPHVSK